MKLYVWFYLQSFVNNYHGGIAYALAHSKERAIELIVQESEYRGKPGVREELKRIEPEVYDTEKEFGDWQFGED